MKCPHCGKEIPEYDEEEVLVRADQGAFQPPIYFPIDNTGGAKLAS